MIHCPKEFLNPMHFEILQFNTSFDITPKELKRKPGAKLCLLQELSLLCAKSHANKAKCKQEPRNNNNVSKDGPT